MPNWGTSGDLKEQEVALMAKYLLNDPPPPPEFGLKEMKADLEGPRAGRSAAEEADEQARPR